MRIACATHSRLMTGSIPGIAASTSDTWVFGSPPKAVEAPEKSFARETTCAWTSRPITTSQSPVAPLMSFAFAAVSAMSNAFRLAIPSQRPRHAHHGSGSVARPADCSIDLAEREQGFLVERPPDELQAERQPVLGKAGGRDESGQARHVHGHGEDVVQIHLHRVGGEPFSPMPKAAEGVAGVRIASTPSAKARSKSRLISVRIFCART